MNETERSDFEPRPRYTCCHPNAKGTGCAVRFELHPAHGRIEGSIFVTFSPQKTVGVCENGKKILPTFDWENRVTIRLSVNEVAEMLEIFRGYREKLGDGNGLFHRTACSSTVITLEHRLEPSPGYFFGVSRKLADGELRRMGVLIAMKEAMVLSESLASAMLYMAFGVPKVISREERADDQPVQSGTETALKEVA